MPLRPWMAPVIMAALLPAGCGAAPVPSAAPSARARAAALRASAPVLGALHRQASRLLSASGAGFRARLRSLGGWPVVVNTWASGCGPCQMEFPAFQRASVRYGRRVAVLGLDAKDGSGTARAFLSRFPVSYPSYFDPQGAVAQALGAAIYFPQTMYFDRQGRMVFDHEGPYESAPALERDNRRYALR